MAPSNNSRILLISATELMLKTRFLNSSSTCNPTTIQLFQVKTVELNLSSVYHCNFTSIYIKIRCDINEKESLPCYWLIQYCPWYSIAMFVLISFLGSSFQKIFLKVIRFENLNNSIDSTFFLLYFCRALCHVTIWFFSSTWCASLLNCWRVLKRVFKTF